MACFGSGCSCVAPHAATFSWVSGSWRRSEHFFGLGSSLRASSPAGAAPVVGCGEDAAGSVSLLRPTSAGPAPDPAAGSDDVVAAPAFGSTVRLFPAHAPASKATKSTPTIGRHRQHDPMVSMRPSGRPGRAPQGGRMGMRDRLRLDVWVQWCQACRNPLRIPRGTMRGYRDRTVPLP